MYHICIKYNTVCMPTLTPADINPATVLPSLIFVEFLKILPPKHANASPVELHIIAVRAIV